MANILNEVEKKAIDAEMFSISKPYKIPNQSYWSVSVQELPSKEKFIQKFDAKEEAQEFYNNCKEEVIVYTVNEYQEDGTPVKSHRFYLESSLKEFQQNFNKNSLSEFKKEEEAPTDKKMNFLERFAKNTPDSLDSEQDNDDVKAEGDLEEKKKLINVNLLKRKNEFDKKAKNILMSIASVYLDAKMINKGDYLKYKFEIYESRFSELLTQLDIAKMAINKIHEQIHTDKAGAKTFDSLGNLIRLVVDITKLEKEYLDDIENFIIAERENFMLNEAEERERNTQDTNYEDVKITNGKITVGNRAELISGINEYLKVHKKKSDVKIPKSVNKKLHDEDEDVGDIVQIHNDEETDAESSGSGIESFNG
jgi:hypothetical protein